MPLPMLLLVSVVNWPYFTTLVCAGWQRGGESRTHLDINCRWDSNSGQQVGGWVRVKHCTATSEIKQDPRSPSVRLICDVWTAAEPNTSSATHTGDVWPRDGSHSCHNWHGRGKPSSSSSRTKGVKFIIEFRTVRSQPCLIGGTGNYYNMFVFLKCILIR